MNRVHAVVAAGAALHPSRRTPVRRGLAAVCTAFLMWAATDAGHAQISVSADGQPSFSYPIAVPPGIAGVQPELALVYGGGGNGPLGMGWVLAGTSVITRCPATKDVDGVVRGVRYAQADKLCLDHARLIQTDAEGAALSTQADDSLGLADGACREFRTEKDNFARIRACGSAGDLAANGPAYFKMWTKAGQVFEYGTSPEGSVASNAQILAQGRTVVAAWAVSRVTEATGNYIDFKYTAARDTAWGSRLNGATTATTGREWNLAEVQYTGNKNVSPAQKPTVKVVFSYSDRPDNPGGPQDRSELFHQGSKSLSILRLDAVRTYIHSPNPDQLGPASGAVPVKVMKLAYDKGPVSGRSRLVSITDCVGANEAKCAPPFRFEYTNGGNEAYERLAAFNLRTEKLLNVSDPANSSGVITGDFDGNGRTDLLRWSNTPANNTLLMNQGDGTFATAAPPAFNLVGVKLQHSDGCYYSLALDANGDGRTDVLRLMREKSLSSATSCGTPQHLMLISQGDGSFVSHELTGIDFFQSTSVRTRVDCANPNLICISQTLGRNYHLLDVNSDGVIDIVTTLRPAYWFVINQYHEPCASVTCTRIYIGRKTGGFDELLSSNVTHLSLYADPAPSSTADSFLRRPHVGDIDGDGLADIVAGTDAWLSRGNGDFDQISVANVDQLAGCLYPLDLNGDGRTDCLVPAIDAAGSQAAYVSDGTSSTKKLGNFNLTSAADLLMESSGTGGLKADLQIMRGFDAADVAILRRHDDASKNRLYLSSGDGTFRLSTSFDLNTADRLLGHSDGKTELVIGDFTGRGHGEILRLKDTPSDASEATANQLYVRRHVGPPADLLTGVTTPTGAVSTVQYASLLQSGRYTSDGLGGVGAPHRAQYPLYDLSTPMPVVVTLSTDSGTTVAEGPQAGTPVYTQTQFAYFGLKGSHGGRGQLGFRETRQETRAPNGDQLTVVSQHIQQHPYIGSVGISRTLLGGLEQTGAMEISRTESTYCDSAAGDSAKADATPLAPCPLPPGTLIARPYLYKSVETGRDLDGTVLPTVTTTNSFSARGDQLQSVVETTGTALGQTQTTRKINTNEYEPDQTGGDQWILGRLKRSTVRSTLVNGPPQVTTSPGTSPTATDRIGTGALPPMDPAVLNVILQLLLDD